MALRLLYNAARLGLRLRGLKDGMVPLPEGSPVPRMAFVDGRDSWAERAAAEPETMPDLAVFVHGLGSSVVTWSPVLPPAASAAPFVAPDLPGYGRTGMPPGKSFATLREQVDAMIAFLDVISPDAPVHLIGQSMGGWIAARTAAERPERVSRLTLVNSAGILHPQVFEQRRLFTPSNRSELRMLWKRMWHRLPSTYYLFEPQYLELTRTPMVRGFLEHLDQDDFLNEHLKEIRAPTLLIWGLSDQLISYESVRHFCDGLPDVRYRPMPDCGHVAQRECTNAFLRYLLPWMSGMEPPEPNRPGVQAAEEAARKEAETARERALEDPEVRARVAEATAAGVWREG